MNDDKNNSGYDKKIHVMPKEFYGSTGPQKSYNIPQQAPVPMAVASTAKPKKSKAWLGVLIVIIIILIGVSGWFLYLSYFSTIQQNEEPTIVEEVVPIEVPEEEPVVEQEIESEPEVVEQIEESTDFLPADLNVKSLDLLATIDTDNDGLTDDEEYLLDLDPSKPDSDADGYLDGDELINLYNPAGIDPSGIEYSGLVTTYVNPTFDYDLYYPQKWLAKAVDQANLQVMFTSTLGEFVNVLVEENNENLTLVDWYKDQVPGLTEDDISTFTNKNNLNGIMSPDGFTAYFVKGRFIYILHYNIGLKEAVSYPNIFQMMIESFVFTGQN